MNLAHKCIYVAHGELQWLGEGKVRRIGFARYVNIAAIVHCNAVSIIGATPTQIGGKSDGVALRRELGDKRVCTASKTSLERGIKSGEIR